VANKVVGRAIASLEKKATLRRARWREACAAERTERVERDELAAFVERYLNLRDRLARDTDDWDEGARSLYMYAVLREVRRERKAGRTDRAAIGCPDAFRLPRSA
jgi:hypothetical protein